MAYPSLGGVTAAAVEYALDGLSLRQSLVAANIANGKTEGYRPMSVDFERQLAFELRRMESSLATRADLGCPDASLVRQGDPIRSDAGQAVVDHAVLDMNKTVMSYQALIEGLNKYMSMTSTAIDGGRR